MQEQELDYMTNHHPDSDWFRAHTTYWNNSRKQSWTLQPAGFNGEDRGNTQLIPYFSSKHLKLAPLQKKKQIRIRKKKEKEKETRPPQQTSMTKKRRLF